MIKNYRINPGEYKHKITILRNKEEKDRDELVQQVNEEILKTKAKIINVKSKDFFDKNIPVYTFTKKVYIRKPKNLRILESDNVLIKGVVYEIDQINNVDELDKFLEMVVKLDK